jgi:hypothetical protein
MGGALGWWVGLGQFLIGDASPVQHAFVCVGDHVVEAMPGGALLTPLDTYRGRGDVAWSRYPLTDAQRVVIVGRAVSLIGTPYSFLDYLAIALDHWGIRPKRLRRYVASSGHLICSALVDDCYRAAGVHLFADGRDVGDVTPGDLARLLLTEEF